MLDTCSICSGGASVNHSSAAGGGSSYGRQAGLLTLVPHVRYTAHVRRVGER